QLGARWREYEQWQRAQQAAGAQPGPSDWEGFAGQTAGGRRYEYRTASEEDMRDMFGDEAGFSDFFETFFGRAGGGGQPRAPRPRAGADLDSPIEVSLAEAYRGTTRTIQLQTPDGQTRRLEVKM